MKRRPTHFTLALGALWAATACGSNSDGAPIQNSAFEHWTDSHPTSWEVQGDTERVGTWHSDDYAIELISDGASVSQVNNTLASGSVNCLEFSLIAKIARGAKAFIELDFLNDGAVEFSARIPTSDWEKRTFRITPPTWFKGVRFSVRKEGSGQVILAELAAQVGNGGCNMPPLELLNRPDGVHCSGDEDCTSGRCMSSVCGGCASDADCEVNHLCGLTAHDGMLSQQCVATASRPFGAICSKDDQCQSGLCAGNACSECALNECGAGMRCERVAVDNLFRITTHLPHLCAPARRMRDSGELCTVHEDCRSLACIGSVVTCVVGCANLNEPGCASRCTVVEQTGGTCR